MKRWSIFTDLGRRRVLVPAVALFATVVSAACTIGPTTPEPAPPKAVAPFTATRQAPVSPRAAVVAGLSSSFAEVKAQLSGPVGVAIVPIGGAQAQTFGDWDAGVSWSTVKV